MIRDGKIITPALTDAVLESITRNSVIQLAKGLGYEVIERTIDRTELYTADEAFLCGSAMELTPVLSIDRYKLSEDTGSITGKLQRAYLNTVCGKEPAFRHWVTPIYGDK